MSQGNLGAIVAGTQFGVLTHLRALRGAGITVPALVGRDPDKTARRAARMGAEGAYASLSEALALPNVDLVAVATRAMRDGLIGEPRMATLVLNLPILADPAGEVPDWWADAAEGGGWLGAARCVHPRLRFARHAVDRRQLRAGRRSVGNAHARHTRRPAESAARPGARHLRRRRGGTGSPGRGAAVGPGAALGRGTGACARRPGRGRRIGRPAPPSSGPAWYSQVCRP